MGLSLRYVGALATLSIVAAACSGSASPTTTAASAAPSQAASAAPSQAASAAPSQAASVAPASEKKLTIGIVTFSMTDVATNGTVKGAQDEAAAKGWTSSVVDAQGSVDLGNTAMEDYVQKKVDAIVVIVFPSNSLGAGLAAAKAANIPVYTMGGGFADGISAMGDDWMGEVVADRILKDTGGSGDMLGLVYRGGLPCLKREASYQTVVDANKGITSVMQQVTVPGQVESASAATLAWIAGHPNGKAIWTCFDDPAMGAVAALKQSNKHPGDVLVYGFNGNPDAVQAIKDGWLTATLWIDHTKMGKDAVDAFPAIIAAGASWQQKVLPSDYILVDKTNVDQFIKDHPAS